MVFLGSNLKQMATSTTFVTFEAFQVSWFMYCSETIVITLNCKIVFMLHEIHTNTSRVCARTHTRTHTHTHTYTHTHTHTHTCIHMCRGVLITTVCMLTRPAHVQWRITGELGTLVSLYTSQCDPSDH